MVQKKDVHVQVRLANFAGLFDTKTIRKRSESSNEQMHVQYCTVVYHCWPLHIVTIVTANQTSQLCL